MTPPVIHDADGNVDLFATLLDLIAQPEPLRQVPPPAVCTGNLTSVAGHIWEAAPERRTHHKIVRCRCGARAREGYDGELYEEHSTVWLFGQRREEVA